MIFCVTEMPRTYKRKPGTRRYQDYTEQHLEECLRRIKRGEITQRQAEKEYNIPRRTLTNKLGGKHKGKTGRPTVFSIEEEKSFVKCTIQLSDYGFPISEEDLRHIVAAYLQKTGRNVPNFKLGYLPGPDWLKSFMKRHSELTTRFVSNIKRARAAVSEALLKEYVTNLSQSLENVPPENIFNYDETNLTDDPGLRKCVIKRGTKYPQMIRNSSKSSISIMMAGSASGELLPPFVVYKSTRLWSTWVVGGPDGTRYANTQSGWFDALAFEEWFERTMLPVLKQKEGVKVMIGDNLTSHISPRVIQLCEQNNIRFICLPANSTHLTQPLDVAFFKPLKVAWRKVLTEYKQCISGSKKTTLDKEDFPALLKKLMSQLEPNQRENLKSGFRKCSIYPIDVQELLGNFKNRNEFNVGDVEDSFKSYLDTKTQNVLHGGSRNIRKKKLQVAPGRSIGTADLVGNNVVIEEAYQEEQTDDPDIVQLHDVEMDVNLTDAYPELNILQQSLDNLPSTSTDMIPTTSGCSSMNPFAKSPKRNKKKRLLLETEKPLPKTKTPKTLANKIKQMKKEMESKKTKASEEKKSATMMVCVKCSMGEETQSFRSCRECGGHYHMACVPKNYDFIEDSDDEETEDFFLCPRCKAKVVGENNIGKLLLDEDFSEESTF